MRYFVRYQVLTAANMKLESSGTKRRVVTLEWTDVSEVRTLSIIDLMMEGSTHVWKVGILQRGYTALHPRRL
jgi:UDP-N-acetylglucosamine enolpyruvyl transferase